MSPFFRVLGTIFFPMQSEGILFSPSICKSLFAYSFSFPPLFPYLTGIGPFPCLFPVASMNDFLLPFFHGITLNSSFCPFCRPPPFSNRGTPFFLPWKVSFDEPLLFKPIVSSLMIDPLLHSEHFESKHLFLFSSLFLLPVYGLVGECAGRAWIWSFFFFSSHYPGTCISNLLSVFPSFLSLRSSAAKIPIFSLRRKRYLFFFCWASPVACFAIPLFFSLRIFGPPTVWQRKGIPPSFCRQKSNIMSPLLFSPSYQIKSTHQCHLGPPPPSPPQPLQHAELLFLLPWADRKDTLLPSPSWAWK